MTDDATTTVLTFYAKANFLLRISIFIALLWPLSLLTSAMVLDPHRAQTVIPIIDLVPLLAALFLVIGAPLSFALLLRDPLTRKGLLYLTAFIGIELTIGVYLALIPVSTDIGLVPLLITTGTAFVFLRVAGIAQWLRNLLALLLIGITITFIAGGRKAVQSAFSSSSRQAPAPIVNAINYQAFVICPDAWEHDFQTRSECQPLRRCPPRRLFLRVHHHPRKLGRILVAADRSRT